jgi:hypothetical protein
LSGASSGTACIPCPSDSNTLGTNATSRASCLCNSHFYDANASEVIDTYLIDAMVKVGRVPVIMLAAVVECTPCTVGTACTTLGATLEHLPLRQGYYRLHAGSDDVRRCPDAAAGCSVTGVAACHESTSGCRGGEHLNSSCAVGLHGTFCLLCLEEGVVYRDANSRDVATCIDCDTDGLLLRNAGFALGIVAAAVLVAGANVDGRAAPPSAPANKDAV